MKSSSLKIALVIAGAFLFNAVFWEEKIALNAVIFDLFVLLSAFFLYPGSFRKTVMKWLLPGHFITLIAVVVHNTLLSKIAFSTTLLLVMVFTQYEHRSLWYAGASACLNYVMMIPSFMAGSQSLRSGKVDTYQTKKYLRFIVIPLIMLVVFAIIYRFSNAVFDQLLNMMGTAIANFFSRFFDWFSWERFFFMLLGLFITGGLLLARTQNRFSQNDLAKADALKRTKHDLKRWKASPMFDLISLFMGRFANGIMALRNENTVGVLSLALLNVLLFAINWLDIVYVWFGFSYNNNINLTEYVHEGAGLLIFSIVLAMLVLLFFFRGNLNFYKKNKWLRMGAYCWIFQNTILVISVLFRDYYYIHAFGLAYKRIGVLVFLLLVMAGLITVFIKIRQLKTTYFLLRVNAWVVVTVLVAGSCIHWDETIASYNLARKASIPLDVKFLLSLSDKVLPLLEQNPDVLNLPLNDNRANSEGDMLYRGAVSARDYFNQRKAVFYNAQHQYSWLSWNLADAYVKDQLYPAGTFITTSNAQ